jgi:hypothetical protein
MRTLNFERCIKNALRAQPDFCSNRAEPERPDTAKTSLAKPSRAEPEPGPQPELTKPGQAERSRSQDKPSWAEPGRAGLRFFFHGQLLLSQIFFSRPGPHFMRRHGTWGSVPGRAQSFFFHGQLPSRTEPIAPSRARPGRAGPTRAGPGRAGLSRAKRSGADLGRIKPSLSRAELSRSKPGQNEAEPRSNAEIVSRAWTKKTFENHVPNLK